MTREEITLFEKVATQLQSFYNEITVLVKKDPKGEMNEFKLKLINKILVQANEILAGVKPFDDFEIFDIELLPNNGDVVMILGQYINCFEQFRKDKIHCYSGRWYWNIDGEDNTNTEIRTSKPAIFE